MLHNAVLLWVMPWLIGFKSYISKISDIQYDSELRRGVPAAHCLARTAQSINSVCYAYFLAQQELKRLRSEQQAVKVFTEELANLHGRQGIKLYWRETLSVPPEDEYLLMIFDKAGGLPTLAASVMQAVSTISCNLLSLAELMGLILQTRDDHQN